MVKFRAGDKVRVKDRLDWPSPPGFRLANAEGTVVKWVEYNEVMEEFGDYCHVLLENANGDGKLYIGNTFVFRVDNLQKV